MKEGGYWKQISGIFTEVWMILCQSVIILLFSVRYKPQEMVYYCINDSKWESILLVEEQPQENAVGTWNRKTCTCKVKPHLSGDIKKWWESSCSMGDVKVSRSLKTSKTKGANIQRTLHWPEQFLVLPIKGKKTALLWCRWKGNNSTFKKKVYKPRVVSIHVWKVVTMWLKQQVWQAMKEML